MGAFVMWKWCIKQRKGQVLKFTLKWKKAEKELKEGKKLQYLISSCFHSKIMEWKQRMMDALESMYNHRRY